ncbi:MAG: leucyl/phenylalanyl-tRNA--protein transferase [Planctomycetales bacterium]|nr:leucyl/phenylalanyl-tRNA--protein transferase [Planctomycetales bacterium]
MKSTPPWFPPLHTATEDGLLMIGGQLTVDWLLAAYRQGIFPWPCVLPEREVLAWFSPDPRAIIELPAFHASRRLQRRLRRREFRLTINESFSQVIGACAEPRGDGGVWITADLWAAYEQLHEAGHAHSVEAWQDGSLVGGVFGMALGGYFAAESMFHRCRDASKAALCHLVEHLGARGHSLLDIQVMSEHCASLGASEIPRDQFLRRLHTALASPTSFLPRQI